MDDVMTQIETDIAQLLNTRGRTHGDYAKHADITQQIKLSMQVNASKIWTEYSAMQRESLEMIAHKIGRILAGDPDFRDHWDDIAGYAKLVADRCTK